MAVLARHRTSLRAPRGPALVVALVFCAALGGLAWLHAGSGSGRAPSESAAHAAVFSDPAARRHLARLGFDQVRTTRLDDESLRVSFFNGRRIVLEAAVSSRGGVRSLIRYDRRYVRIGSQVGQRPPALAALLMLFALATLRLPLRRVENADALALAAFVVPVVLMNERYVEWSVIAACVPLSYLALRCGHVALGRAAPAPAPGGWMLDRLSPRIVRLFLGCAAAALVLLSIPGGLAGDVALASMSGATRLLDGTLPYGHLNVSQLVHGDTYPLLAYVAYLPAALVAPVRDGFDNLDASLYVATASALIAAIGVGVAVRRAGGAGERAALATLAFPPVMIAASSGSNDTVAAALVAVALACDSTAVLVAAGWVKLAPLAVVPLWIAGARGRTRAAAAALGVTAGVAVTAVALGGPGGIADMLAAMSFQAERGSLLSPWALLGAPGAQIVFQAAVAAGIAAAAMKVGRDRALAGDPRRVAALGAAIMLAVQLAANYWSYTYLAWAFPLIAVALLSERRRATPSRARAS